MTGHNTFLTEKKASISGVPSKNWNIYLDTLEQDTNIKLNNEQKILHETLLDFLNFHYLEVDKSKWDRWCITLIGNKGNGKSTISQSAVNYMNSFFGQYELELSCYITLDNLINEIKETFNNTNLKSKKFYRQPSKESYIWFYSNCRFLVIDEIKPQDKMSEFEKDILQQIIINREASQKPLILIGNITADDIRGTFDDHVLDRLNMGYIFQFKHESYRKGVF